MRSFFLLVVHLLEMQRLIWIGGWFLLVFGAEAQLSSSYSVSYLYRRPRCQTVFPTHSQLFHSQCIVLVGRVDQVRPLDSDDTPLPVSIPGQGPQSSSDYMATVLVRRVLHGPRNLQRQRIQVSGFNPHGPPGTPGDAYGEPPSWCHPNTEQGDSWIFVLQPVSYPIQHYRLNNSLIKVTLANLDKFDAIIADQPYGLRPTIEDLPCELKYCPNNGNCLEDPYAADGARCECLSHCKSKYEPICGSDYETYNNECELRLRSCRAGKNLFVLGLNSCYYFRSGHRGVPSPSSSSSSDRYRTNSQDNYRPSSIPDRYRTETSRTETIRTSTILDRTSHPY